MHAPSTPSCLLHRQLAPAWPARALLSTGGRAQPELCSCSAAGATARGPGPACSSTGGSTASTSTDQQPPRGKQYAPGQALQPISKRRTFGFATGFEGKYALGAVLGTGTFGAVHEAVDRATGERVAVKVCRKRFMGSYLQHEFAKRVQHEFDVCTHLGRSLNVVYLHDAYEDDKHVYLVMELCTGGELWGRISRGQHSEESAARIISEVLRTIAQCHSHGVVIRDVKPENFLYLHDGPGSPLKMIDFSLAQHCAPHELLHEKAGTVLYCAPELLRGKYSFKADVWSAGIIAYELLTVRMPFTDDDGELLVPSLPITSLPANRDIFAAIIGNQLDWTRPPWPTRSALAADFVKRLLTADPDARPTALEALSHPWIEAAVQDQPRASTSDRAVPLKESLVQRLQQFGQYSRLKQLALSSMVPLLDDSATPALAALRHAFEEPGPGGESVVPYAKVVRVLKEFALSDSEVRQLLKAFTRDANGDLKPNEWLAALVDWREMQTSKEWDSYIARVFDTFDTEHSGRLGLAELEALLCPEGCPVEDTVPAALRSAEADSFSSMDDDGQARRAGGLGLDLPAFAQLLRIAQMDKLELYEPRTRPAPARPEEPGSG